MVQKAGTLPRSHAKKGRSWVKTGFVAAEAVLLAIPLAMNSNSSLILAIVGNQKFAYHILTPSDSHGKVE